MGVDTYLSRCRHGRAGRVLRVGVSVTLGVRPLGPGVLGGGLGRRGCVVHGMRHLRVVHLYLSTHAEWSRLLLKLLPYLIATKQPYLRW